MMNKPSLLLLPALVTAAVLGCYGATTNDPAPTGGTPTDVPCDVATVLGKCTSCHGTTPTGGAPMSLMSLADLKAPSPSDPNKTNAQLSVERMQAGNMPPGGGAQADAATLAAWIQAGYPIGSCTTPNGDGGTGEYPGPAVCTNGAGTTRKGSTMRPGEACIACHAKEFDAPTFWVAGTLYPTGRERMDCKGVAAGATVKITDANNAVYNLAVNSAGNFYLDAAKAPNFKGPYKAEVIVGSDVRAMGTAQTDGDCNGCHGEPPTNGAPGRIVVPGWTP
jgi:mono/diheme cytochrome c family protein